MRPLITLSSLVALTLLLVLAFAPASNPVKSPVHSYPQRDVQYRGILDGDQSTSSAAAAASSSTPGTTSSAAAPTSTPASTSSAASDTSSAAATPTSTTSSSPLSTSSAAAQQTSTTSTAPESTPSPTPVTTTNSAGQTVIVTQTDPPSAASSPSASSTAPASNSNNSGGSQGVSTSTIVGLSVAGGVAVLGIIGFFVWKFSRKRFSDLDDNEAIKWPELSTHDNSSSAPLPTNRIPGAGFDTEISRPGSRAGGYAASIAATSTTELYPGGAGADPYAVPPLPQFNPNQPYRDDPNAFYDPYRGPVPQTFEGAPLGAETIPMTQLSSAGRRSPGPGAAYNDYGAALQPGGAYGAYNDGRSASPAPGPSPYGDRARSPGPGAAMAMGAGGRASPAPSGYGAGYAPR